MYIKQRERAMFGRRRDGFQIEEEFIIATIAVTILEHKENFGFARFFFDRNRQRGCRKSEILRLATAPLFCNDVALVGKRCSIRQ